MTKLQYIKLEKDIEKINKCFPKLIINISGKFLIAKGEIDLCSIESEYLDTYTITILILQKRYPRQVPILIEDGKIPRIEERHISKEGICCVDMDYKLSERIKQNLTFYDFLIEYVIPYLTNQYFYDHNEKRWANGEYDHGILGKQEYWLNEIGFESNQFLINGIEYVLKNSKIKRNDLCFCGSTRKTKNCHISQLQELRKISKKKLIIELEEFKKLD